MEKQFMTDREKIAYLMKACDRAEELMINLNLGERAVGSSWLDSYHKFQCLFESTNEEAVASLKDDLVNAFENETEN